LKNIEKFSRKSPPVAVIQVWWENKIISRKRHGNNFSRTDWCDASGITCSSKRLDMTLTMLYCDVSAIPCSRMSQTVWSVLYFLGKDIGKIFLIKNLEFKKRLKNPKKKEFWKVLYGPYSMAFLQSRLVTQERCSKDRFFEMIIVQYRPDLMKGKHNVASLINRYKDNWIRTKIDIKSYKVFDLFCIDGFQKFSFFFVKFALKIFIIR